jgi:hypothetical protein
MEWIAMLLALVFGAQVDHEKGKSDAAVGIAYAVVAKPDKPQKVSAKCSCKDCKCVDCKCENCGEKCACLVGKVAPKQVWKFFRNGNTGEQRLLEGDKVIQVKKFKLTNLYGQSCNGRTCSRVVIGHKWVEIK